MSLQRKIHLGRRRRTMRVRQPVLSRAGKRVSVFRSLQYIYAQLIDDQQQRTLASCSSRELSTNNSQDKKSLAFEVGKELARRALSLGVEQAVFDRGRFLYHGRVRSLAEGLREGGLHI